MLKIKGLYNLLVKSFTKNLTVKGWEWTAVAKVGVRCRDAVYTSGSQMPHLRGICMFNKRENV